MLSQKMGESKGGLGAAFRVVQFPPSSPDAQGQSPPQWRQRLRIASGRSKNSSDDRREVMPYESVDRLQNVLVEEVFHYAKDAKKAAGRALGTLVEIITFYLLKSWGFEHSVAIERALAEYGNPDITHNVEYSLHPIQRQRALRLPRRLPVSAGRVLP